MSQAVLLDEVRGLIAARERDGVAGLAQRIGPSEWADVVPHLDPAEISALIQWLPDEEVPELLAELDPHQAATILRTLTRHDAADLLEAMAPDDATDVVDELPDAIAEQILIQMEAAEAAELRELLAFPSDTAGGIMTPAYVAVAPDLRTDQAIAALRQVVEEAETLSYVYVLNPQERLLGVLPLHRLVLGRADRPVHEFMITDPIRSGCGPMPKR